MRPEVEPSLLDWMRDVGFFLLIFVSVCHLNYSRHRMFVLCRSQNQRMKDDDEIFVCLSTQFCFPTVESENPSSESLQFSHNNIKKRIKIPPQRKRIPNKVPFQSRRAKICCHGETSFSLTFIFGFFSHFISFPALEYNLFNSWYRSQRNAN